jgi:hypothetical protein
MEDDSGNGQLTSGIMTAVPPPSFSTGIETDTSSAAKAGNENIHSVTSINTPVKK